MFNGSGSSHPDDHLIDPAQGESRYDISVWHFKSASGTFVFLRVNQATEECNRGTPGVNRLGWRTCRRRTIGAPPQYVRRVGGRVDSPFARQCI